MSVQKNFLRNLNRDRVLEFEKEMQEKLAGLPTIERDLKDISDKRKIWLKNISSSDKVEVDSFLAKLNVMKLQSELSSLQMTLDCCRLDGHYEAQALKYLVAATQPMGDDESEENRRVSLQRLLRQDSDELLGFLEHSLHTRIQLGNLNYDLQQELTRTIHELQLQQIAEEEEFNEKITYYTERMNTSMKVSKQHYGKITEEYLILRHNARVAKEVLVRSQNEASQARQVLQNCLEDIVREAESQREKMEKISNSELKYLTDDLRSQVVRKEQEFQEMTVKVKMLKRKQKKEVSELREELKVNNRKYKKLQSKRKQELQVVQGELGNLRSLIAGIEQRLSSVGVDVGLNPVDLTAKVDKDGKLMNGLKSLMQDMKF
jgi:hypothetical protein